MDRTLEERYKELEKKYLDLLDEHIDLLNKYISYLAAESYWELKRGTFKHLKENNNGNL